MKNPGGDIPFLNSRQTILIHGKWRENSEPKREKIIFQLCSLRTEGLKWTEWQNPREQLQKNFPPKWRRKLSAVVEPVMAEKQETQGPQYWVITKTKQLIIQSRHNSAQHSPCFISASYLCYYYCYCYFIHVAEGVHQWPLPSGINFLEKRKFQGSGWTPWTVFNNPTGSWVDIYGTGAIFVIGNKRISNEGAGGCQLCSDSVESVSCLTLHEPDKS